MFLFTSLHRLVHRAVQTLILPLALALGAGGPALAGVDANGYPSFQEGEILSTPDAHVQGVRLVCMGHAVPTNWGRPMPRERHGNFEIQTWQETGEAGSWRGVGTILTQYKDDPAGLDPFGTHLRIRTIDIKDDYRHKGIGTQALKVLMASYNPARFATYKTEISDLNEPSKRLFARLGFTKAGQIEGIFNDVANYVLPNPEYQAPAAAAADDGKTEQERCAACGKTGDLKRCGRCRQVHYCGPACQRQHWKTHKPACKADGGADQAAAARAAKSEG